MTKAGDCEEPTKFRDAARRHELGGGPLAWTTGKGSRRAVTSRLVPPGATSLLSPDTPAPAPGVALDRRSPGRDPLAPRRCFPPLGSQSVLPGPQLGFLATAPVGRDALAAWVSSREREKGAPGRTPLLLVGDSWLWCGTPEGDGPLLYRAGMGIRARVGVAYQLEPLFYLRAGDGGEKKQDLGSPIGFCN